MLEQHLSAPDLLVVVEILKQLRQYRDGVSYLLPELHLPKEAGKHALEVIEDCLPIDLTERRIHLQ